MTRRIYAACLASYNAGTLHGAWIDASDDVDAMRDAIAAMLRASPYPNVTVQHPDTGETVPSAEEWAIHDHEGFPSGMGEYVGLETIAAYVAFFEACEDRDISEDAARAYLDNMGATKPHDIERAADSIADDYAGVWPSLAHWAENMEEECGELDKVPERLRNYIDFDAIGRDARLGGDVFTVETSDGVAVFWNR